MVLTLTLFLAVQGAQPAAQPVDPDLDPYRSFALPPSVIAPPHVALRLRSDAEVQRARDQHAALLMMVEHALDHGCKLAGEMFDRAADQWSAPGNVTFARIDMDKAPGIAKSLGARLDKGIDGLPKYALSLADHATPIKYSGGWSENSLSAWLHQQLAMKPVEARNLVHVARIASQNPHGLAIVGLLSEAQRSRRLLELAARGAEVRAAVVLGDETLAAEMGVEVPSVVVVSSDAREPWAMLRPPLTQQAVEKFLWRRALPLVIKIGDHKRDFARHVREHAHELGLQAILVHISGARGTDDESESALAELHRAALKRPQAARYLAYDFFDNDPEQFVSRNVYASELPTLILMHARGKPEERTWRIPEGEVIRSKAIVELIERATDELKQAAALAAPDSWQELAAPEAYEDALDKCEAEGGGE